MCPNAVSMKSRADQNLPIVLPNVLAANIPRFSANKSL